MLLWPSTAGSHASASHSHLDTVTVSMLPLPLALLPSLLQLRNEKFKKMEKGNAFNNLLELVVEEGQRECRCMMCNRAFENQAQLGE